MSTIDSEIGIGPGEVHALRRAELLTAETYLRAVQAVRDETYWALWAKRALLALGLGQFLAGIFFFFAYNWNDLPDLAKFAVIEIALALSALGAFAVGIDRLLGKSLLVAASALVGVLLGVIGQIYQTGADVYELFLAWSVLILPWTLISRNAAQWLLWLVLSELALSLFAEQVLVTLGHMTDGQLMTLIGVTLAAALAARELAVARSLHFLSAHWTRLVLVIAMLSLMFLPAAEHVGDFYGYEDESLSLAFFLLSIGILGVIYWRVLPDFASLVMVIAFADAFFIITGIRIIDETIGFSFTDDGQMLAASGFMILWAVAGTGGAAMLMRRLRRELKAREA